MAIAKILVPVCGHASDEAAIATAIAAARPFAAHVALISVHEDPALAIPQVGVPMAGGAMEAIVEGQMLDAREAAQRTQDTLTGLCRRENIAIVETAARARAVTCSHRQCWGDVAATITRHAALSDLVVMGPMRWSNEPDFNAAFLSVLRDVRRPVLVAEGAAKIAFEHVAIGWDGSATSANAMHAAMDFLRTAKTVTVITVASGEWPAAPTESLVTYLAHHGVTTAMRTHAREKETAAERVLIEARDIGADLLVAGAYGHDHLREAIFGGATETLASKAAMPVLLAH